EVAKAIEEPMELGLIGEIPPQHRLPGAWLEFDTRKRRVESAAETVLDDDLVPGRALGGRIHRADPPPGWGELSSPAADLTRVISRLFYIAIIGSGWSSAAPSGLAAAEPEPPRKSDRPMMGNSRTD